MLQCHADWSAVEIGLVAVIVNMTVVGYIAVKSMVKIQLTVASRCCVIQVRRNNNPDVIAIFCRTRSLGL
jgi:hypothetical protein